MGSLRVFLVGFVGFMELESGSAGSQVGLGFRVGVP